jgi:ABC-type polysaccharide/polyol phosphate transport system ATPase subunit
MAPAIIVDQVSKIYRVGTKLPGLTDLFGRRKEVTDSNHRWAVKELSFTLNPGESLALIGPNGAGKTTTLKMLSRVTKPTLGSIVVNGRMSALIELGAGFHPDLTGRENVFLNGTILGMRRAEIARRFDQIIEFAGIGEYIDTPVKRYSSGMYARLGFAIAAHIEPQVLLVDEVLAVGDYAFQMKCYARMDELKAMGTSLILVTHNLDAVRRVCDHGLVMYRGERIYLGPAAEAVVAYSDAVRGASRRMTTSVPEEGGLSQRVMTFDAEVKSVMLSDLDGRPITVLESGSKAYVVMDVLFNKDVSRPIMAFTIKTPDGVLVYNTTTHWMRLETEEFRAGDRCRVRFLIEVALLEGFYELGVDVTSRDLTHFYDRMERSVGFSVTGGNGAKGLAELSAQVSIERLDRLAASHEFANG